MREWMVKPVDELRSVDELRREIEPMLRVQMRRLQDARFGRVTYPGAGNEAKVRIRFPDGRVAQFSVNVHMLRGMYASFDEYMNDSIRCFLDKLTNHSLSNVFHRLDVSVGPNFSGATDMIMEIVKRYDDRGVWDELRIMVEAEVRSGNAFVKCDAHRRALARKVFIKAVREAVSSNLNRDDLVQIINEELVRNVSDQ